MLEYVFFQDPPRKRFQEFLTGQGLAWTLEPGDLETLVVVDEAGLDDDLAERIESMYDALFAAEQTVQPPPVHPDEGHPIVFRLPDGRALEVRLPRELAARVLTVVTPGELTELAESIALSVLKVAGPPPQSSFPELL